MTFLILGLLLGTLVGFFTATLLVCAARNDREEGVEPFSAGGPQTFCDARERPTVAAAARG